tara:strand:+ start:464 stop:1114 length:651 start_codon:yes stop_codon:yes gene_type:complete
MATYSQPHPRIKIYDNVLSESDHEFMFQTCLAAPYFLGWGDTVLHKQTHLHSTISGDVWDRVRNQDMKLLNSPPFDIVNILSQTEACREFKDNSVHKSVINLDTIADTHAAHDHRGQIVALLYINPFWKPSWGGETLFFDSITDELILAIPYTPNRIVVFDGEIDHSFNGPNIVSQIKHRFSISTFFYSDEMAGKGDLEEYLDDLQQFIAMRANDV